MKTIKSGQIYKWDERLLPYQNQHRELLNNNNDLINQKGITLVTTNDKGRCDLGSYTRCWFGCLIDDTFNEFQMNVPDDVLQTLTLLLDVRDVNNSKRLESFVRRV